MGFPGFAPIFGILLQNREIACYQGLLAHAKNKLKKALSRSVPNSKTR